MDRLLAHNPFKNAPSSSIRYAKVSRPDSMSAPLSGDNKFDDTSTRPSQSHGRMSFHDISVPRPKAWTPFLLRPFAVGFVIAILIGLAAGCEGLLSASTKRGGFKVGATINEFGGTQLLKSFVPAVLTLPIIWLVTKVGGYVIRLHPYLELAKGNAPARNSVLLDYSHSNSYKVLLRATLRGQGILIVCALVAIIIPYSQSLAASMFLIRITPFNETTSVVASGGIGLNPEVALLSPFVAAAGFVDAAVMGNFGDPEFVLGTWAIPTFNLKKAPDDSDIAGNFSVTATLPGVNSWASCVIANNTATKSNTGYTVAALIPGVAGCTLSVNVDSPNVTWQSGVSVIPTACVPGIVAGATAPSASLADEFKPVAFWVFSYAQSLASVTFCQPMLFVENIDATISVDGAYSRLTAVQLSGTNYTGTNNVTGPNLNGVAFNGMGFSAGSTADKFVQARSVVAPATIADAILRSGRMGHDGLAGTLKNETGFPNIVSDVYTRFLALAASNIYYTEADIELGGILTLGRVRLWVDPFAAHSFASMMSFIALLLITIHVQHYGHRKKLFLSTEPGSLAAAATILSHSRFASTLINANDDEDSLEKKLKGMTFGFDRKTWQVEADQGTGTGEEYALGGLGGGVLYQDASPMPYSAGFEGYQTSSPPGTPARRDSRA